MKTAAEIINEVGASIYEIRSLIWCIRDILEDDTFDRYDYTFLAPVARIVEDKFNKLEDDFSILEIKIKQ